nr:MAG TPA: hypothetical protein [Caudoviricetes sp.]
MGVYRFRTLKGLLNPMRFSCWRNWKKNLNRNGRR